MQEKRKQVTHSVRAPPDKNKSKCPNHILGIFCGLWNQPGNDIKGPGKGNQGPGRGNPRNPPGNQGPGNGKPPGNQGPGNGKPPENDNQGPSKGPAPPASPPAPPGNPTPGTAIVPASTRSQGSPGSGPVGTPASSIRASSPTESPLTTITATASSPSLPDPIPQEQVIITSRQLEESPSSGRGGSDGSITKPLYTGISPGFPYPPDSTPPGDGNPIPGPVGASFKPNHTGAIVGGVLGALAIFALSILAFLLIRRRLKRNRVAPSAEFLQRYGNSPALPPPFAHSSEQVPGYTQGSFQYPFHEKS